MTNNCNTFSVKGNIVDVVNNRIYKGIVFIKDGKIEKLTEENHEENQFIMPGFIDSHVHIESSMLIPSEFARIAVMHGTVATVSDPHEIANVMGIDGVKFMIANGKKTPFKFFFGAPSCVPATPFETSGHELGLEETEELLAMDEVCYLAEMMNFPGVLNNDDLVIKKLELARKYKKPIDGHAPGLTGNDARKYADAGIDTDHECFTINEAEEKIKAGMKVLIREGSAAKNFNDLIELLQTYPDEIMFCSDDKHPDDLVNGHMNILYKRSVDLGFDPVKVLKVLSYNPVKHYGLNVGMLQQNDDADFIITNNLKNPTILKTYIRGKLVAENGKTLIPSVNEIPINNFHTEVVNVKDIEVTAEQNQIKVIGAMDAQLITKYLTCEALIKNGKVISNTLKDILKIVVINRYKPSKPACGFVNGFGLKSGAIASTVAHDSHNIIAVGVDDKDIVNAVNLLIREKGGVSFANGKEQRIIPLSVAGLMSADDGFAVAKKYEEIDKNVKLSGCNFTSPYMTLSFMALLVIPELKLSDKGLFDGKNFELTSLFLK